MVLEIEGKSVSKIFGYPDDLKLKFSMTLFSSVVANSMFSNALDKYFENERDDKTLALLGNLK
jgi:uncharacterized protein (DUF1810 family)